jgi:hypothetical protein
MCSPAPVFHALKFVEGYPMSWPTKYHAARIRAAISCKINIEIELDRNKEDFYIDA